MNTLTILLQIDIAQDGLNNLTSFSNELNTTTTSLAVYIIASILLLGLIGVIWAIATQKSNAKDALIAWFVALIFAILFILS